jgi:hypothetical protein
MGVQCFTPLSKDFPFAFCIAEGIFEEAARSCGWLECKISTLTEDGCRTEDVRQFDAAFETSPIKRRRSFHRDTG